MDPSELYGKNGSTKDPLSELERLSQKLEHNVQKLRLALTYWQTQDAEYEGLKEEILGAGGEEASEKALLQIGKEFGGSTVNEKEIKELLGQDQKPRRNGQQVIDLISRRQDYVQKNTVTVRKQLEEEEERLNKARILEAPDLEDEEGNPLTDIREELDEDGNVISSEAAPVGKAEPKVWEALRKAGITETDVNDTVRVEAEDMESDDDTKTKVAVDEASKSAPVSKEPITAQEETEKPAPAETPRKKSVSFAPDTKGSTQEEPSLESVQPSGSRAAEVEDEDVKKPPVVPSDESSEDAAIRRDMLEYGLNEVGAVVAELSIDDLDDPNDSDFDEDEDDYEDDEDDEFGRSLRSGISEDYRQEMLALEQKLNARMMTNVGPPLPEDADLNNMLQQAQGAHRLVVRSDTDIADTAGTSSQIATEKKGVRFSEDLDVSPAPGQPDTSEKAPASNAAAKPARPIAEAIIERSSAPAAPTTAAPPAPPRKTSRFKSARTAPTQPAATHVLSSEPPAPRTVPTGPADRTLANTVIEHEMPAGSNVEAPDADGTDPALLQQEVATEYHRLRNRMIQRQGGFLEKGEDEAEGPMMEEDEDGKVRKVSRFRAARLGRSGL